MGVLCVLYVCVCVCARARLLVRVRVRVRVRAHATGSEALAQRWTLLGPIVGIQVLLPDKYTQIVKCDVNMTVKSVSQRHKNIIAVHSTNRMMYCEMI